MREEIIDDRKEDSELRDLAKSMGAATDLSSSEKNTETLPENQEQKPKSSRIYQCPQEDCKRAFTHERNIKRHLQGAHSNIKSFCCKQDNCKKKYKTKAHLETHIKSFHLKQKFSCTEEGCSKIYGAKVNLSRHMIKEHNRSLTEHPLGSSSSASSPMPSTSTHSQSMVLTSSQAKRKTPAAISEVNQHQDPQSPGTHPFKRFHQDCSDIHPPSSPLSLFIPSLNSSALTDSFLGSPISSIPTHSEFFSAILSPSENNTETLPENQEQKPKSSRIYQCPQKDCKRVFENKYNVKRHLQEMHSEIKPFCCTEAGCERKYKSKSALTVHIKSFHQNQKFHCSEKGCSKIYAAKVNLSRHMIKEHNRSLTEHPLGSSSSASSPMPSTSTSQSLPVTGLSSSRTKRKTPAAISEVNQHQEPQSPGTHPFKRFHQDCSAIHSPFSPIIAVSPSSPLSLFIPSLNSSSLTDSEFFSAILSPSENNTEMLLENPQQEPKTPCCSNTHSTASSISLSLSTPSSSSSLTDSPHSSSIPSTTAHSQSLPVTGLSLSEKNTEALPENQEQKPKSSRIYQCPQKDCKSKFTRKFAFKRHLQEIHSEIKPFCCTEAGCKKKYKNKSALTAHIKSFHQKQKFHCEECPKIYAAKVNLSEHMIKKHNRSLTEHPLDSSSSASSPMPSTSTSQSLPVTGLSSSRTKRKTPAAMAEVKTHGVFPLFDFAPLHKVTGLRPQFEDIAPPITSSPDASYQMLYQNQLDYLATQNALPLMSLYSQQGSNQQTQGDSTHIDTPQDSSKQPESPSKKRKEPAPLARNDRYSNRYSIVNSFSQPNTGDLVIQTESERSSKASNPGK